ncbi:MAG: B12-binding domain-containing radical SAM protein [Nitrospirae bacterium]|nr:B12-binding domain-containing radical SAM protein [Nitrospirota bacterium]
MIEKTRFRVLLVYPNLSLMLTPSYAVALFTSLLKNQGYEIDLFDATPYRPAIEFLGEALPITRANKMVNSRRFEPGDIFPDVREDLDGDFARKLDAFKPHAAVLCTLVEDAWPQAKRMLEILSTYPDIRTLVGGVFATMAPDIVAAAPQVSVMGTGEGEETLVEFCERVRQGADLATLPGAWVRTPDGAFARNLPRPLVDINRVLPDWSLFSEKRFFRPLGKKIWKTIPIETYRGCPYTCSFCNSPTQLVIAKEKKQGFFLRRKSMETLRNEMEQMIRRYSPEFFYFVDDAFMARPKAEIASFARMYRDFKIPFWFQTRLEDIDEEKLTWLQEVGCYRISFGLEHGNEAFRKKVIERHVTNAKILEKCSTVAKVGIPFTLNNMVGFPFETRELFFDTIALNREIGSFDSVSVNIFVPYHGTGLRDAAVRAGWLDPERQTTSVIGESILDMPAPYLSAKEILGLQRTFPLHVKLPISRAGDIRRAESFDELGNKVFERLSREYYQIMYGEDEVTRRLTYVG